MQKISIKTVYVTPSGKKFHIDPKCSYIKLKPTKPISYEEAKIKFGGPCSRCFGYDNLILNNNQLYNDNTNYNNIVRSNITNYNVPDLFHYKNFGVVYNSTNIINKNPLSKTNEDFIKTKDIINDNAEVQKNNDIDEEEQRDKISDFLLKSGSISLIAGGGIGMMPKPFEDQSSEIDFNNKKYCNLNDNAALPNNISYIKQNDTISENDNISRYINNLKINEEEDHKSKINKIVKKNELTNNNDKIYNVINQNLISESKIDEIDDNSETFKIINNKSDFNQKYKIDNGSLSVVVINNKDNINNKKENGFFSYNQEEYSTGNNSKNNTNKNCFVIHDIESYDNNISSFSSTSKKLNNRQKKLNLDKGDMDILIKTSEMAKILPLENSIFQFDNISQISNIINQENNGIKILNNSKNNKIDEKFNGMKNNIFNESFKFTFEINPKNQSKINTKIEVGFEIEFIDEEDDINNNNLEDEDESNDNSVLSSISQKLSVLRQLKINKKTNVINALINVKEGKFFVVGNKDLNGKNNKELLSSKNNNILYLWNFQKINPTQVKQIIPIFKYEKKDLYIIDIIINGKNIINNQ